MKHYQRDAGTIADHNIGRALRDDKPVGDGSNDLRHDTLLELWDMSEQQQHKARRVIAGYATDAADCAQLLEALGLGEEVERRLWCSRCSRYKLEHEFAMNQRGGRARQRQTHCRVCSAEKSRERRQRDQ